ncbi:MAG: hypothetical protein NT131_06040 [Methanomassiliicoccales archaeon]|nr:hypothetical protein [Methanomassiliicoccales archaeon]
MSSMFDMMEPLTSNDVGRLCEKGFISDARLNILSQMLFPQLCSIIERGLTLEEIGLLAGFDRARTKKALKKSIVKGLSTIVVEKADSKRYVKVSVPLVIKVLVNEEMKETISKEPLLAPKSSVNRLLRKGYRTKDGRSLRYDYLSFVPGPMPTVYFFKSGKDLVSESVGDKRLKEMEARFIKDKGAMKADREIALAQLNLLKCIFESEFASEFIEQMTALFFSTYDNVHRYAYRFNALGDMRTFNNIEKLAQAFLLFAQGLEDSGPAIRPGLLGEVVDIINAAIGELNNESED